MIIAVQGSKVLKIAITRLCDDLRLPNAGAFYKIKRLLPIFGSRKLDPATNNREIGWIASHKVGNHL